MQINLFPRIQWDCMWLIVVQVPHTTVPISITIRIVYVRRVVLIQAHINERKKIAITISAFESDFFFGVQKHATICLFYFFSYSGTFVTLIHEKKITNWKFQYIFIEAFYAFLVIYFLMDFFRPKVKHCPFFSLPFFFRFLSAANEMYPRKLCGCILTDLNREERKNHCTNSTEINL